MQRRERETIRTIESKSPRDDIEGGGGANVRFGVVALGWLESVEPAGIFGRLDQVQLHGRWLPNAMSGLRAEFDPIRRMILNVKL